RKRSRIEDSLDDGVVALRLAAADGSNLRVLKIEFLDEDSQQPVRESAHRSDADAFAFQVLNCANLFARDNHIRQSDQWRGDENSVAAGCHAGNRRIAGAGT